MSRRRRRTHQVVGVAIDGDVIRGVQLRRRMGRVRAIRAAAVELEQGAVENGRLVDAEAVATALRNLWDEGGFTTKNLAIGIDGRDATFRRLTLPTEASDSLSSAARYELSEYLPYGLEDAVTSVHEISRGDEGVDVVAVAVRRAATEQMLAIARDAGLRLVELTLASTAVGAAVPPASDVESDAVVTVDGGSTTIMLRRGGQATVARVLSSGGGGRTAEVADEIAEALATLDRFRSGGERDSTEQDAQRQRFRDAADEVAAAIHFELTEQRWPDPPASVLLGGAYGEESALHSAMASAVSAPVSVVPTPDWWDISVAFAPFVEAAGIAAGAAFSRSQSRIRLDPPSVVARDEARRQLTLGTATALAIAIGAGQLVLSAETRADVAEGAAIDAEVRADHVVARYDALEEVAALDLDIEHGERMLAEAIGGEIEWPRLLDAIGGAIPDDTFFTGVTLRQPTAALVVEDTTASFSGIALDQTGVAEWLLAVDALPGVEDLWLVQSTASVFGDDELPVVSFIAEAHLTDEMQSPRARGLADGVVFG